MIKKGDYVAIKYIGFFDNREVFDTNEDTNILLEFQVGSGEIIKNLDDAVLNMNIGEEKEIRFLADNNHAMAGKFLNFKFKIIDVNKSPKYRRNCQSSDCCNCRGCNN